jgi:hypothetical protein
VQLTFDHRHCGGKFGRLFSNLVVEVRSGNDNDAGKGFSPVNPRFRPNRGKTPHTFDLCSGLAKELASARMFRGWRFRTCRFIVPEVRLAAVTRLFFVNTCAAIERNVAAHAVPTMSHFNCLWPGILMRLMIDVPQ